MKRLLILSSLLFMGLSFNKMDVKDNAIKASAASEGSYATLLSGGDTGGGMGYDKTPLEQAIVNGNPNVTKIINLVVTTDASKVKEGYEGSPVDVGANSTSTTDGCNVAAYFYPLAEAGKYDAIFYADVETIYAPVDSNYLFSGATDSPFSKRSFRFTDLVTVTLDKGFNTSKVREMGYMFAYCPKLEHVYGLEYFDFSACITIDNMFTCCKALKEVDFSRWDLSKIGGPNLSPIFYLNRDPNNGSSDPTTYNLEIIYMPELGDNRLPTPRNQGNGSTASFNRDYDYYMLGNKVDDDGNVTKAFPRYSVVIHEGAHCGDTSLYPTAHYDIENLANEIISSSSCDDYAKAPQFREKYNALNDTAKAFFNTIKDYSDNGVLLIDKLAYMEGRLLQMSGKVMSTHETRLNVSSSTGQNVLIGTIGFSFVTILGYYLIQKKKYAR